MANLGEFIEIVELEQTVVPVELPAGTPEAAPAEQQPAGASA